MAEPGGAEQGADRARLTSWLLNLPDGRAPYLVATRGHRFLELAGARRLPAEALARWLAQDRLYALLGYTRFIGQLIARIPQPTSLSGGDGREDAQTERYMRRLKVLVGAASNIEREVRFFDDVAKRQSLFDCRAPSAQGRKDPAVGGAPQHRHDALLATTRAYIDYMGSIAAYSTFEEALVLLWAMEKLYLDAWSHVASMRASSPPRSQEPHSSADAEGVATAEAALQELVPNWSSPGFAAFVDDIAHLVDELPSIDARLTPPESAGAAVDPALRALEAVWLTTLPFEARFWDSSGCI